MEPTAQENSPVLRTERVSLAEYARRIGVNRSTVTRQVQSGLIPAHDGMIDPEEADAARKANLDTAKRRLPVMRRASVQTSVTPARPEDPGEQPAATVAASGSGPASAAAEDGTLTAARIRERAAKAGISEFEYAKLRGELVSAEAVEQEWARMVQTARDRMLIIPERLADKLSMLRDAAEIRSLLLKEINEALTALAKELAQGVAA